ncbi:MAG TPA: DUF4129 domain-containing protein [Candidatus Baltobacteraceae bacterium]|nr:DUF4129 domain-containing protein [Candidatus Baltobacteraceae bacterium]
MNAHPPHDIVRAVRTELATPGRYHLHPTLLRERQSWFTIAFRYVAQAVARLEHAIASRVHVGAGATSAIGDLLLLGALLGVGFVAARLLLSMQLEREMRDVHALLPARSAQALARAASDAAERGDYARAIRLLFAAAVVLLDLRGVVADDESATINELRRSLRARDSQAESPFAAIAGVYTAAVYAEHRIDEGAWASARDAYARLTEVAS